MPKEAVFTMKIEPELRAAFMAEAAAVDRPASQILREMMRDYIQRQQQAREYETFLNQKVARARESVAADRGIDNAEVQAEFAERRAKAVAQA
jgi:predicted transcriptional regulator